MQDHNYNLSDLEEMIPLEREIYLNMLNEYLREKAERLKQLNRS